MNTAANSVDDYSKHFETYKEFLNEVVRYDFSMFEIATAAQILDVGCGFGDRVRSLRQAGYSDVSGVELSPYSVRRANDPKISLGSITATGYPDKSVDVVLVENVFHHIDDYVVAIREIRRILKPGGVLCMIEPRRSLMRMLLDFLTFYTPIPFLLRGPWQQRKIVMGKERETGLYQQWLASQSKFFSLLEHDFQMLWRKNTFFFFFAKYQT